MFSPENKINKQIKENGLSWVASYVFPASLKLDEAAGNDVKEGSAGSGKTGRGQTAKKNDGPGLLYWDFDVGVLSSNSESFEIARLQDFQGQYYSLCAACVALSTFFVWIWIHVNAQVNIFSLAVLLKLYVPVMAILALGGVVASFFSDFGFFGPTCFVYRFSRSSGEVSVYRSRRYGGNAVLKFSEVKVVDLVSDGGVVLYGPRTDPLGKGLSDYIFIDVDKEKRHAFLRYLQAYMEKGIDGVVLPNWTSAVDGQKVDLTKGVPFSPATKLTLWNMIKMNRFRSMVQDELDNHTDVAQAFYWINFAWLGFLMTFLPSRREIPGISTGGEGGALVNAWKLSPSFLQWVGMIFGALINLLAMSVLLAVAVFLGAVFALGDAG